MNIEIKILSLKLLLKNYGQIADVPKNPRFINAEKFEKLKQSIIDDPEMLQIKELIVYPLNDKFVVIGGNMRLEALRVLQYEQTHCKILSSNTSAAKLRAIAIKDNISYGSDDQELLANEWDSTELERWGMDLPVDLEEQAKLNSGGLVDEDEIPEVTEPVAKLGDVWLLSNHRVMCGDSTNTEHVAQLMDGAKADMVFTDPPYGMKLDTDFSKMTGKLNNKNKCGNKYDKVIGDNYDFNPALILTVFNNFNYCKEIFLFGADYFAEYLIDKNLGSWGVWDKRLTEEMDRGFGSCFELFWSRNKHKRLIARITWSGVFGMGKDDEKTRIHPTQKPIKLVEYFFENWGNNKKIIVDLFAGSGSTLIACQKNDRISYNMELDPKYVDVIIKRWENFTGEKATLLGNV